MQAVGATLNLCTEFYITMVTVLHMRYSNRTYTYTTGGNMQHHSYVLKVHLYPSYGMQPDEEKFEDESFADSKVIANTVV